MVSGLRLAREDPNSLLNTSSLPDSQKAARRRMERDFEEAREHSKAMKEELASEAAAPQPRGDGGADEPRWHRESWWNTMPWDEYDHESWQDGGGYWTNEQWRYWR